MTRGRRVDAAPRLETRAAPQRGAAFPVLPLLSRVLFSNHAPPHHYHQCTTCPKPNVFCVTPKHSLILTGTKTSHKSRQGCDSSSSFNILNSTTEICCFFFFSNLSQIYCLPLISTSNTKSNPKPHINQQPLSL